MEMIRVHGEPNTADRSSDELLNGSIKRMFVLVNRRVFRDRTFSISCRHRHAYALKYSHLSLKSLYSYTYAYLLTCRYYRPWLDLFQQRAVH